MYTLDTEVWVDVYLGSAVLMMFTSTAPLVFSVSIFNICFCIPIPADVFEIGNVLSILATLFAIICIVYAIPADIYLAI